MPVHKGGGSWERDYLIFSILSFNQRKIKQARAILKVQPSKLTIIEWSS